MAFTESELVAIRKFCGHGARTASNLVVSDAYGELEYRLCHLTELEESQVRDVYLAKLQPLEDAILLAGDTIDTDKAAIWERNKNEMGDRTALYNAARRRLCDFLGVEPGPGLCAGARIVRR